MKERLKIVNNILFSIPMILIIVGQLIRTLEVNYGLVFFFTGLVGLTIYILRSLLRFSSKTELFLILSLLFMIITVFSKYYYYRFWDYPAFVSLPLFITALKLYWSKVQTQSAKLKILSIFLLILSIPILGFPNFHKSPRHIIPKEWYNTFDVDKPVTVNLPWLIKSEKALELSKKAFDFKNSKNYSQSIAYFLKCIEIEKNPRFYFDISLCYAYSNDLENAISYMDTTIMMDQTVAASYNNRGLYYYKLKENHLAIHDFSQALKLDSSVSATKVNLSLAYYYNEQYFDACKQIAELKEEGYNLNNNHELQRINRRWCE